MSFHITGNQCLAKDLRAVSGMGRFERIVIVEVYSSYLDSRSTSPIWCRMADIAWGLGGRTKRHAS